MSFIAHAVGWCGAVLALLAPLPLAAVLAGAARQAGPGERLLALLSWWMALGMSLVLVLGWCGVLTPTALLLGTLALLCVGCSAWLHGTDARERILADARCVRGRWLYGHPLERLVLAIITAMVVVWGVALVVVPSDNYDTHMYQLPTVAEWLQHGDFTRSEQWRHAPSYERSMFHYPGGWNAWYALVLGLAGHERWAFLPNLLAMAVYAAAVRALARIAGASAVSATLAAGLVIALPITGIALASAHNDLAVGGVWLAAIAAGFLAGRTREASWLALAILLAGMAVGIKPNGIGAVACAGLAVIAGRWLHRETPRADAGVVPRGRSGWAWIAVAGALAIVIAVPWYVRNAWETGNPLGFLRLHVLGREWPGTIDSAYLAQTTLRHTFDLRNGAHWGWLGAAFGVYLGLAWLGLLLPALRARRWHRATIGLLLLVLVLAWAWISGPWSGKHAHDETLSFWMGQQLRYTFALWGAAAALAAAVAWDRPGWWCIQVLLLWSSLLATLWLSPMRPAAPLLMGLLTGVFAVVIMRGRHPWRRWLPAVVILALLVLPWCLRDWRQGVRNWWFFGAPSALARLPEDRPIAFWGTHQAWLLYGDRLRRRPIWLPLETASDDQDLARMVRASGCDHLAIGETWPPTPPDIIDRLLALGVVEIVHGEPHAWGMKLFRIRPSP